MRQQHRFSHCGLPIQVGENLVDHHRVFDTGDDFDRTTTLGAGFYVDITYRDVGKSREQDAEALNTRFSR